MFTLSKGKCTPQFDLPYLQGPQFASVNVRENVHPGFLNGMKRAEELSSCYVFDQRWFSQPLRMLTLRTKDEVSSFDPQVATAATNESLLRICSAVWGLMRSWITGYVEIFRR